MRPLISHYKEHIINLVLVGTETLPAPCRNTGVISKSPTIKAVKAKIKAEEANFDFAILDKVVAEANNVDIRESRSRLSKTWWKLKPSVALARTT
ncbi:hypothetical protein ACNKHQ_02085 [Shigella flexneri]